MKVTFLGTGTSLGVPLIGCSCPVCTSADKRDNRLRCSIWIETPEVSVVIDSGPDFRYQMLRAGVKHLDAIVYTHGHKDHVAGMDDVRAYNFFSKEPMHLYATEETQQTLKREFSYVFSDIQYPGIPRVDLNTINAQTPFAIKGLKFTPILVKHMYMDVLGFRVGDFTYITDANYISPEEAEKIKGSKTLVLNALRHEQHPSHYTLDEAIDVAKGIGVEETYFTHISHQLGRHEDVERQLPEGFHLSYDGLTLDY
ncbi:MAG: MBL fold metallo-hydrolase [Chitinophagales bacterium]|nr:MBL fold metallo-hydrolase [Chitinophagales bacterium]